MTEWIPPLSAGILIGLALAGLVHAALPCRVPRRQGPSPGTAHVE